MAIPDNCNAPMVDAQGVAWYPASCSTALPPAPESMLATGRAAPAPNALITGGAQAVGTAAGAPPTNALIPMAATPPATPPAPATPTGLFGMSTTTLLIVGVAAFFLLGGHKH